MKVLDLFSGIGGFSLGLERAGMETVAFCEIEEFPRRVLAKHWPGVPIHKDITELDGEQYRGSVDLVCGGFPCQPFSQAGQRRGEDDDRALWPEMLRVIREVQPTWVIAENVIGFESMGLADCESDLESNGFAVQPFDIPACGVGAPHRRHRLWIVAHSRRNERGRRARPGETEGRRASGDAQGLGEGFAGNSHSHSQPASVLNAASSGVMGQVATDAIGERRREERGSEGRRGLGGGSSLAANANDAGREQQRREEPTRTEYKAAECGIGWPTEPPLCGPDDGISDRVARLRALGNAVVPQIPEIIGRGIMEMEAR